MKHIRNIIIVICLTALSMAGGADRAKEVGKEPLAYDLKELQGIWEGVEIGDQWEHEIKIQINGSRFHFYRDTDFWFDTTIQFPSETEPKQLHATIKNCPDSQKGSIGKVVGAIYKIEEGTLTLYAYDIDSDVPESFDGPANRYVLKRIKDSTKQVGFPEADETVLPPFPSAKEKADQK